MKGGDVVKDGMLRIEEVAVLLDCSINTINSWYRFRAQNPDNEYAKILPDYVQEGGKTGIRLWKRSDIPKFVEFQIKRPVGRAGVMGTVTQKYVKHTNGGK